jgi:hypothetical protein
VHLDEQCPKEGWRRRPEKEIKDIYLRKRERESKRGLRQSAERVPKTQTL